MSADTTDLRPAVGDRVTPTGCSRAVGTVVRRPAAVTYVIVAWDADPAPWEQMVSDAENQLTVLEPRQVDGWKGNVPGVVELLGDTFVRFTPDPPERAATRIVEHAAARRRLDALFAEPLATRPLLLVDP